MKARIIERKWIQEWFDERWSNHMPSLTLGYDDTLLATWSGGLMTWFADPASRGSCIWTSRLEQSAKEWSVPEALGSDMKYACHDDVFIKNRRGDIFVMYGKFLHTDVNTSAWCKSSSKLWTKKSKDGGLTWLPAVETNLPMIGHASNDGLLLPNGDMLIAISSNEDPERFLGNVRILRSTDDGETWQVEDLLKTEDGTLIREPAITLRPDGSILMFTRACPADMSWGADVERKIYAYKSKSTDNGKTWSTPVASTITNNESKIDLITWSDGTLLMGYDRTTNLDWHERSPLWLAYSKDEGETWEDLIEIAPGPGNKCQPAMCQGPDGLLHLVYMHRHTAIEHVVVEIS